MKHTKLFSILSTFTYEEMSEFSKYVSSPYFNQNENVIKLFNTIKPFHPHYYTEKISNENLHLQIYPGVKVNTGTINNLITRLITLAEGFLTIRSMTEEVSASDYYLLIQFERRKLDTLFNSTLKNLKEEIEKTQIHDERYYYDKYLLNELEITFSRNRKPIGKLKTEYEKMPLSMQHLFYYFYLKIFYNHIRIMDAEGNINFDDCYSWIKNLSAEILNSFDKLPYTLLTDIYTRVMSFAAFKDDYDADETLKLIFDNQDKMSEDMLRLILSPLYNYCKDKEFKGDKSYGLKSLNIIKMMVEKDLIFSDDGTLSDHTYVNYASAAVREKDYEWAEMFTNKYKEYLNPLMMEDAYCYNHAVINYIHGCDDHKEEYFNKALKFLSKIQANDFYYKTRIFLLSLNIFLELKRSDTLVSLIDSFKHYLSAHKKEMPLELKERYLNFSNFLERFINFYEKPKLSAGLKLRDDILAKDRVEFKKRLLSKTDEIISTLR